MDEIFEDLIESYLNKYGIGEVPSKIVKKLSEDFRLSEDEALKIYKEWRTRFMNKA